MNTKSRLTHLSILTIVLIGIAVIIFYIQRTVSLPDYGITTNLHGNITNPEAQSAFVDAYLQGNSGRWEKIVYGIEGDPIIYSLRYNNQPFLLEVTIDSRLDMFGVRRIKKYACQKMIVVDKLRLTGCVNAPSGEIVIP